MAVDLSRELGLANQLLDELKARSSTRSASDAESIAWQNKVVALIRRVYGANSQQEGDFWHQMSPFTYSGDTTYRRRQQEAAKGFMEALVQDLESRLPVESEMPRRDGQGMRPMVFIAHGGESTALSKVMEFIKALGCVPMVAERKASTDRSVNDQVEACLASSDCAIILATQGDVDGKTGDMIPRGNILVEVGRCQERFPGKIVWLLEGGTKFPSNVAEKVWERFAQDNMDRAFLKIVRELVAFGFLKAERQGQ